MAKKIFVTPEWMESYRALIEIGLGGNTLEECMNDTSTFETNLVMSVLACQASAKVTLLANLKENNLLK